MKQFYYLEGKNQIGPFETEELKKKRLNNKTLVWSEGMDEWKRLDEIPDLYENVVLKIPPPIPESILVDINIINKKKAILILVLWSSFHFFALILSYSGLDLWSSFKPRTSKFWPFVDFNLCNTYQSYQSKLNGNWIEYCFTGVFADYDWSEFSVYIALGLLLFALFYILNKK